MADRVGIVSVVAVVLGLTTAALAAPAKPSRKTAKILVSGQHPETKEYFALIRSSNDKLSLIVGTNAGNAYAPYATVSHFGQVSVWETDDFGKITTSKDKDKPWMKVGSGVGYTGNVPVMIKLGALPRGFKQRALAMTTAKPPAKAKKSKAPSAGAEEGSAASPAASPSAEETIDVDNQPTTSEMHARATVAAPRRMPPRRMVRTPAGRLGATYRLNPGLRAR